MKISTTFAVISAVAFGLVQTTQAQERVSVRGALTPQGIVRVGGGESYLLGKTQRAELVGFVGKQVWLEGQLLPGTKTLKSGGQLRRLVVTSVHLSAPRPALAAKPPARPLVAAKPQARPVHTEPLVIRETAQAQKLGAVDYLRDPQGIEGPASTQAQLMWNPVTAAGNYIARKTIGYTQKELDRHCEEFRTFVIDRFCNAKVGTLTQAEFDEIKAKRQGYADQLPNALAGAVLTHMHNWSITSGGNFSKVWLTIKSTTPTFAGYQALGGK